nr:hypothetical protein [Streptomyces sp. DSM 41633]
GEADPIVKDVGDAVMSGSFVVAGSGAYRATKVGHEAYAAKLAEEASKFTLVKSELRNGINKILQFITYLLVPAGLLIIYSQLFTVDPEIQDSLKQTYHDIVDNEGGWRESLGIIMSQIFTTDAVWHEPVLRMVGALVPMV